MHKSIILTGLWLAASSASMAFAQSNAAPAPRSAEAPHHGSHMPRTRAEIDAKVREQFAALDRNKDGYLTPDELAQRGGTDGKDGKSRGDRVFAIMDKDGDGQVTKAEFDAFRADRAAARESRTAGRDEGGMGHWHRGGAMMAAHMFRAADTNHDGKVSLAEAETATLARFDKVDTNHDGVISDPERMAARDAMRARFAERMHRDGSWHSNGDTPPPAPAAPASTNTH